MSTIMHLTRILFDFVIYFNKKHVPWRDSFSNWISVLHDTFRAGMADIRAEPAVEKSFVL